MRRISALSRHLFFLIETEHQFRYSCGIMYYASCCCIIALTLEFTITLQLMFVNSTMVLYSDIELHKPSAF
jgi:hypothetical protein